MDRKNLPVIDIEPNKGQIPGLPANPREISDADLAKLRESLHAHPDLTEARGLLVIRHGGTYVAIGGNQRLRALRESGAQTAPAIIIPEDTDAATLRAYTILDNAGYGAWIWEDLLRDWTAEELRAAAIFEPDVTIPPQELSAADAEVTLRLIYADGQQAGRVMEALAAASPEGDGSMEAGLLSLLRKNGRRDAKREPEEEPPTSRETGAQTQETGTI